jgi:hypothetical protein
LLNFLPKLLYLLILLLISHNMEFVDEFYLGNKFSISLISEIQNFDVLLDLEKNENIVILNPDYVIISIIIKYISR